MGNGRRGRSWGIALGSFFVLLLASIGLLWPDSRHDAQKAIAQVPASPISSLSKASLPPSSRYAKPDARALLAQLPMIFEPNRGQADANVKFLARGAGYSLFLDPTGAVLAFQSAPNPKSATLPKTSEQFVRMKLVGANPAAATAGTGPLPGKSNYLIGNDPKLWHSGIPQFGGVHYANVYPGIDLVFYGSQGNLEYDFNVAPGADPSQAELQFDGASQLELSGGDLILTGNRNGGLRLQAPNIYQRDGERHQPVSGHFVLRSNNRVGFEIGAYDHSRELVIDPVLQFSTYFGGNGSVSTPSIAVSGSDIYLVGTTTMATGFPDQAISTQIGTGNDIFVAKILPSQPAVSYLTFLGGSGSDTSIGIGADNGGKAYIVGNTTSTNFPTSNTNVLGYQTSPRAKGPQCAAPVVCKSIFVTVLNASGNAPLFYSSYLSGNGDDEASGMTIDLSGDVFITGTTTSNDVPSLSPPDDFPATNFPVPYQALPNASIQFFVTKVNTSVTGPSGIAYSTYFGGSTPTSPIANGGGIAVDTTGNIYFSGTTNFINSGAGQYGDSQSTDFPILNAYQPCLDTPPPTVLPVSNPCTTSLVASDAFLAKLNPNAAAGSQLLFSTYLGGTGTDTSTAVAVDSGAANIYLTGSTNSADFILPTGAAAFENCLDSPSPTVTTCPTTPPTNTDAYVARFNNPTLSTTGTPNNVGLTYFSYLGGTGNDGGTAVAVLNASSTTLGDVLVTGTTFSTDFPVTQGAIQSTLGTGATQNAFFAQIDTTTTIGNNRVGSYATYFGGDGADIGTSLAVDTNQNSYLAGQTTSNNLQLANNLPGPGGASLNGTQDAFVLKLGSAADLVIQAPTISPAGTVSAGNAVTTTFNVVNEGPDPATNITVTGSVSAGMVFNTATAGSGTCSPPSGTTAICTIPALQSGSLSAVVFSTTPSSNGSYSVIATVSSSNNTSAIQPDSATASFSAGVFSLSINPPARSVVAGTTVPYTVTLTPNPLFGNTVSLTCGALPSGASCNFVPSGTVTLNGPQSVTLNLVTTPQPVNTASFREWRNPLYALWLMIPGMAVLSFGTGHKRRGKVGRVLGLFALCVLFALVLLQPACSGNKTQPTVSGTPSGTYSLTVTATSGSLTRTVPFSLTVTP